MTWIKICGITNLEDARTAVEAGANALGFVFYEKSPRKVDAETARQIVAQLPEAVEKVGVFVNDTFDSMEQRAMSVGLTAIQVHGEQHRDNGSRQAPSTIKRYAAVPASQFIGEQGRFEGVGFFEPEAGIARLDCILLDSGTVQQPGGTGKRFDWEKAVPLVEFLRQAAGIHVVIAGGLTPENVREVIRILHPWGVDVASGVEARPGKKDPEKVRAFVQAVREADKSA